MVACIANDGVEGERIGMGGEGGIFRPVLCDGGHMAEGKQKRRDDKRTKRSKRVGQGDQSPVHLATWSSQYAGTLR